MKRHVWKKTLSFILCIVLIAAMALSMTGCNGNNTQKSDNAAPQETVSQTGTKGESLGEGETEFTFHVVDLDGKDTSFEIHTDKTTVGDALTEVGLIEGEESEYGLYVKTVAGTTLDYDKDGKYWAFYVNDEYATAGVDSTEVEAGAVYAFKAE